MKLLKVSKHGGILVVVPQVLDDLWHLEKILEKGDIVTAETERKIKPKEQGQDYIRIKMFLDLELKEVSYDKFTGQMRLSGIIVAGKPEEFVELKSHHSISLELGEKIKIKKTELKPYTIERLKKAEASVKKPKLLIVALDDEQADFGLLSDYGLDHKLTIFSERQGKQFAEQFSNKYFQEIFDKINSMAVEKIILSGPGFVKADLAKFIKEKNSELQVVLQNTNNVGITGLNELIKTGIADKAVEEFEIVKETNLLNKVMAELGKNSGKVEYGFNQVKEAVESGAVEELLIVDKLLMDDRKKIEGVMDLVESMRGKVHIISSEHDAGKQLQGISGIAALLRYKLK
ncbi:MAG: mRNA surveillance protein pelota [Candidatus Diapherotrites archaeon]|nr:mRNA surveillance protein pelota [Candidatus Diapherotrites archaeon]